jgi:nitric oxide dioxygenase
MSLKVELLEASFDKIKPRAKAFGESFYNHLFTMYPEAKPLFANTDMLAQREKLIKSLVLVVSNLRSPDFLTETLQGLGSRHVEYGALPEHYPLVGNALLTTFEEYLGDEWTDEVKQAWVEAYGAITEIMLEGADYDQAAVSLEAATPAPSPANNNGSPLKAELLEQSLAKVTPQANAFGDSFYHNLFTMYPAAKPLFASTDMKAQRTKLINSLVLVVENLRSPDVLSKTLKGLGSRHVKYGALPEHYPLVGNALLTTFEQYLGDDWTDQVKQAWVEAYGAITELMLEGADYDQAAVSLESAAPPEPIITEYTQETHPDELNWSVLGGAFVGGGILTILLLLIL